MDERRWAVAYQIAQEWLNNDTDLAEVNRLLVYLRTHSSDEFFELVSMLAREGRSLARSSRSLEAYGTIAEVSEKYLRPYAGDLDQMTDILGWSIGLARPYRERREPRLPIPKLPEVAVPPRRVEDLVGDIVAGTVSAVASFGAFVDIGADRDGLVHISEIGEEPVQQVRDVLSIGDLIKVKVVSVDAGRIRLSMKGVLQPRDDVSSEYYQAVQSLEAINGEFVASIELLNARLCSLLGFRVIGGPLSVPPFWGWRVEGDALQRLQLPKYLKSILTDPFPLIYPKRHDILPQDVRELVDFTRRELGAKHNFGLLVALGEARRSEGVLRRSVYKSNFIVLDDTAITEFSRSKLRTEAVEALGRIIRDQVDLNLVSPFVVEGPVPEDMFFGREQEIGAIVTTIDHNNFTVVGNRRIGKTSVLNRAYTILSKAPDYQAIKVDCQPVHSYNDFFQRFGMEVMPQTADETTTAPFIDSPIGFYAFVSSLKERSERQIVILLDEVDDLLHYDLARKEQLFKVLRSLAQSNVAHFVFSGVRVLYSRINDPESPFFNYCEVLPLGLLSRDNIKELVIRPFGELGLAPSEEEIQEDFVSKIIALTSCHPNLVNIVCRELVRDMNERVERDRLSGENVDRLRNLPGFLQQVKKVVWGAADPLERLITVLMRDQPTFRVQDIERALTSVKLELDEEQIWQSLRILELFSILRREERDLYTFAIGIFPKVLKTEDISLLVNQATRYLADEQTATF